ncbi:MAG: recombinase family protein [Elusimicrobia bacterium]|nr:recombinase family protein [Patescibacteria group bacterium]MBU1499804.1 recombinase family protein [Patescibacteria group bacterium]MBU2567672.1 recombinase family protein [Elusimicrobiota bacterium]
MDEPLDITKLKYVLYARKSTIDKERQVRSIQDQINDCKLLANQLKIHVVKILKETQSAKKPGQRPIFRQMIKDIKQGIYDAILAWNPDRLARNMLEGGEIINLVDEDVLKDLKFKTHFFTKDANGKMLLGMAFVLSKQYSDDLSQKVGRAVRSRFQEGKTSTPKHGYINEAGVFRPDGQNFKLICDAWQMRLKNKSIEDISDYLNKNGYSRIIKKTGKKVDMDKRILSKIFHDPLYYGVLIQTDQKIDLRLLYDFQPAVGEQDFYTIQDYTYHKMRSSKPHKNVFYPLRGMVLCDYCGRPCVVAPSAGYTKKYLYYRCDNQDCTRKKRSIRAKVIFDFIYKFLAEGLNLTEKEYNDYYNNLIKVTDKKRQDIRIQLHNRQGLLKCTNQELNERSLKIIDYDDQTPIYKANANRITQLNEKVNQLTSDVEKLQSQLREPETDRLTIEQFLNLSKKAGVIVKSANELQKDIICREIFLNFSVDEQKVASYQLKEPFDTLLKQRKLPFGRGARI